MRLRRALPFIAALALSLTVSAPAFATSPGEHGEGKTAHFEVPLPETKDAAVKLLKDSMGTIETALAKADFNAIHEATYSVESAIARLAKEPGYDGLTTTVAPRVEIVHLASEQGDAETLKAAVPILAKAVNEQLAALMK